jgi:hypothetical protein
VIHVLTLREGTQGEPSQMDRFRVDAQNRIAVVTAEEAGAGTGTFGSEEQLAEVAASWPAGRLVQIWNALPKTRRVRRFTDRKTALRRIWKAVQKRGTGEAKAALAGTEGTKKSRVIALLEQPDGATMTELMAATGWQRHSIRGFLSRALAKHIGRKVSAFRRDGDHAYRIPR